MRGWLSEGGAGRVYGGFDDAGSPLAIKVLTNPSTDQRKRFKNEIRFLSLNKHRNIVEVTDSGLCQAGPFYVMHRFDSSVRPLIGKLEPVEVLSLYSEVLDGVEAAHFQDVVHRDLKPENILYDSRKRRPAIADFGVARFGMDMLSTLVETSPGQRLANFQYAAPEQRMRGGQVTVRADVYALGLILNELYTGAVPHGTKYKTISDVAPEFGFLDNIVARMLRQNPAERPVSITEVKQLIQRYRAEVVTLQKLSKLRGAVIPQYEIDEPLAHNPPIVVGAGWTNGILTLTLDRPVTSEWVQALRQVGSYYSVLGAEPELSHPLIFHTNEKV
jgi:serine/threonine protein kinase